MVGIASRCPFEGIVMVAYATFFLYLRFAGSLDFARDDKGLREWLFLCGAILEFNCPFRLSEWSGAHGEICNYCLSACAGSLGCARDDRD